MRKFLFDNLLDSKTGLRFIVAHPTMPPINQPNIEDKKYAVCRANAGWSAFQAGRASMPSIPDGYVLVPIEPTDEMIFAAINEHEGAPILPYSFYKAMIKAAPKPTEQTK
jgi:hypothetical protein